MPNGPISQYTQILIGTASADSVESDLGCTLNVYFENVTLTLHNVSIHKNHTNIITSVIAAKQTVINAVFVCLFFQ